MRLIDIQCARCGAMLRVNADLPGCMCQYCGNQIMLNWNPPVQNPPVVNWQNGGGWNQAPAPEPSRNSQMRCKKCKGYHVNVQATYDIKEEKKGCLYYLYLFCGGFIIEIILAPLRLIFGKSKTYRAGARTYAVCQDCGYRWEV